MPAALQEEPRHPRGIGRAWADLPLRSKGLVVVFMAQDRRAQAAVLHTMEVGREIAQVRILVQAGVTGYVLTGERQYLASYEEARRELPEAMLEHIVAWSPMVMFRGLLGGSGERYVCGNVERLLGFTSDSSSRTATTGSTA